MNFQWLTPSDNLWLSLVQKSESDFYHLPSYSGIADQSHENRACAAFIGDQEHWLLVPLIVRPLDAQIADFGHLFDAISPYGYPGPLVSPMEAAERVAFLQDAFPMLIDGLAASGIVSAFIRMHPLVGVEASDVAGIGQTVHHGDTVIVDLTEPEEAFWAQTRKGHRYDINRSRRRGHDAYHDERWDRFEDFLEIYAETMKRVDATPSYFFGREYFVGLREALGDHLHLWVVDIDGETAAASLFTEFQGIVQYHLSGTRTEHLRSQPNKLLLHEVRSWAKARGNRVMHLGGGVGGERDSLFAFKAGFSRYTRPFHSWRLIPLPEVYRSLVEQQGLSQNTVDEHGGFFPAYRKPR